MSMIKIYDYRGGIEMVGYTHSGKVMEIMLYVMGNDNIAPTRLEVPKAMEKYIDEIEGNDREEKYYEKIFRYDYLLNLVEIVIPAKEGDIPAKIITQKGLFSEELVIFGCQEQMDDLENELEPMSHEEYRRYLKFRRENDFDDFYNAE